MKNLILSLGLLLLFCMNAFSQAGDSTISIEKKRIYMNGQVLKAPQVKAILSNNPASAPEFKKYKTNASIGMPLLAVGTIGCLVGTGINLASSMKQADGLNKKESTTTFNALPIILASGVVVVASLPFIISANQHYKKSINNFNASKKHAGIRPAQFDMMVNSDGVGVRMRF